MVNNEQKIFTNQLFSATTACGRTIQLKILFKTKMNQIKWKLTNKMRRNKKKNKKLCFSFLIRNVIINSDDVQCMHCTQLKKLIHFFGFLFVFLIYFVFFVSFLYFSLFTSFREFSETTKFSKNLEHARAHISNIMPPIS